MCPYARLMPGNLSVSSQQAVICLNTCQCCEHIYPAETAHTFKLLQQHLDSDPIIVLSTP